MGSKEFRYANGILNNYNSADYFTTNVVVPYQLKAIADEAFYGACMTTLYIPDSIEKIGYFAFHKCSRLEKVRLPSHITRIDPTWFIDCINLWDIDLSDNKNLYNDNGVIYKDDKTIEMCLPGVRGEVTVHEGVTTIGDRCFYQTRKISEVILPQSLTKIDREAFRYSGIRQIKIPKNVKYIDYDAFYDCFELRRIEVDPENPYFTSVDGLLYDKEVKTLLVVPKGMEKIVHIEESVETIYNDAFYSSNVVGVVFPPLVTKLKENLCLIQDHALFGSCYNLKYLFFSNRKLKVPYKWFTFYNEGAYNSQLQERTWQTLLPYIAPSQLSPNNQKDAIPFVLETLYKNEKCEKDWKEGWESYIKRNSSRIFSEALDKEKCLTLFINDSLILLKDMKEYIDYATKNNLVELSAKLLEYQNENFSVDEVIESTMEDLSIDDSSIEGIKKNWSFSLVDDKYYVITGYKGDKTDIIVPSHINGKVVKEIGAQAFSPNKAGLNTIVKERRDNIKSITISEGIKTIGEKAFWHCTNLSKIEFPSSLRKIERSSGKYPKGIVYGCEKLTEITLPEGIGELPISCFDSCENLVTVNLPSTLKKIGSRCFRNCYCLRNVDIKDGLKAVPKECFLNCESLQYLFIPDTVTSLGDMCFCNCYNATIDIPDTIKKIDIRSNLFGDAYSVEVKCEDDSIIADYCRFWGIDHS